MATQIPTFTPIKTPIANDGDKSVIAQEPASSSSGQGDSVTQKYGIPSIFSQELSDGGKFFQRQDLNGLFHLISQFQYYYQAGGFPTFSDDVSATIGGYPIGAILFFQSGNDSCFVKSRIENNTRNFNLDPSLITGSDTSESQSYPWLKVTPSISDFRSEDNKIRVVDNLPGSCDPGVYYFIRG